MRLVNCSELILILTNKMKRGHLRLNYPGLRVNLLRSVSNSCAELFQQQAGAKPNPPPAIPVKVEKLPIPFFRGSSERHLRSKVAVGRSSRDQARSNAHSRADWTNKNSEDLCSRNTSVNYTVRTLRAQSRSISTAARARPSRNKSVSREKLHEIVIAGSGNDLSGRFRSGGRKTPADALLRSKYQSIVKTILAKRTAEGDGTDDCCNHYYGKSQRPTNPPVDQREYQDLEKAKRQILNKARAYQEGSGAESSPRMLILDSTSQRDQRQFVAAAQHMRDTRVRKIYDEVLSKAGKDSAKKLFERYFQVGSTVLKVEQIEEEMEHKKEEQRMSGGQSGEYKVKDCRKRSSSACKPRRDSGDPTPSRRQDRIKMYGRWYLDPKEFNSRLRSAGAEHF